MPEIWKWEAYKFVYAYELKLIIFKLGIETSIINLLEEDHLGNKFITSIMRHHLIRNSLMLTLVELEIWALICEWLSPHAE